MSLSPPGHHLILGGAGFIGRAVAVQLARAGQPVVLADRRPPEGPLPQDVAARIAFRPFDLAQADWDALIAGAAVVHHYAWTSIPASANADPGRDLQENVLPTIALLDAMRRLGGAAPRLVFASSGGTVYGRLRQVPVPEHHALFPLTAYGAGKVAAEAYLTQYRQMHGLDCRIARVANPFGAGQNVARGQGAVTTFLDRALRGLPIEIWGDGAVTRDYIHVSDAAAGLRALAAAPSVDDAWVFNIGSGRGLDLNTIVAGLEAALERPLVVHRGPARPYDVPISVLDVSLARERLGWTARLSFTEGLAHTMRELRGNVAVTPV